MTGPREVELKLEIAPREVGRVAKLVAGSGTAERTTTLTSVYFDSPRHRLRRAGFSLRVRHDGERRIQTIKAENGFGAGVYDRPEWETEIDRDTPVLDANAALLGAVGHKTLSKVAPVFRSIIERTTSLVEPEDALLEVVVDRGEVVAEGSSDRVCEVEIELKRGSPAALFTLARQLNAVAGVRLGVLTKAERGYRLLDRHDAGPSRAEPIVLDAEMTAAAAFQAIAWSCLRHFRLNEMLLAGTADAGVLHQARVGLRRLRSAISVFKEILGDGRVDYLRGELRWLAATLGDARNIDVLIGHVGDERVLGQLEAARSRAYRTVQTTLASKRSRSLMIDLAEWLTIGSWLAEPANAAACDQPVVAFAGERLERLRKRLKKRGAGLAHLHDEERHAVRIEAKKLRYATEFFASLFTGKKAARRHKLFRDSLEALQGHLGDLNDRASATAVLVQLGIETPADPLEDASASRDISLRAAEDSHVALVRARRFW